MDSLKRHCAPVVKGEITVKVKNTDSEVKSKVKVKKKMRENNGENIQLLPQCRSFVAISPSYWTVKEVTKVKEYEKRPHLQTKEKRKEKKTYTNHPDYRPLNNTNKRQL